MKTTEVKTNTALVSEGHYFTLKQHAVSGWCAFAHCGKCGSSFASIGDDELIKPQPPEGFGWHKSITHAITVARANLNEHTKNNEKCGELK